MVKIDSILQIARRESSAFDEESKRFLIKDFPSAGPKGFVEALRKVNGGILKDVEARAQCVVNSHLSDGDAEAFVALPLKLFPLLHRLLEYIDRGEGKENPYGILSLYTRLIERFESDFEVILKSQWQFSYNHYDLADKFKLVGDIVCKGRSESAAVLQKRLIVLGYPSSHRNSAFMHPVQGQEIGRLFDRASGISSKAVELINPVKCGIFEAVSASNDKSLQYDAMGRLLRTLKNWTEVVVADFFALSVFGPSYLFALNELLTTQGAIDGSSGENPSGAFRIVNLLVIMEDMGFTKNLDADVKVRIDEIDTAVRDAHNKQGAPVQGCLERCLSLKGDGIGRDIFNMVREKTKGFAYEPQRLLDEVPALVRLMEGFVPPIELYDMVERDSRPANIFSIINAGWIVYLSRLDDVCKNYAAETDDERAQVFDIINRLLSRAMDVNEICEKLSNKRERPGASLEILKYMYPAEQNAKSSQDESDLSNRLFITPLLRPSQQLGNLSVDLRLGNEFIVPMKTKYPVLDPCRYGKYKVAEVEEYQEKIYKRYGEPFVLHTGQFVLGCTLEFLRLPNCFSAYIIGRSSWGRLGLTIATAIAIDPGYSGVLTLELLNSGETPIVLYPGARIAQLILHKQTPSTLEYSRKKFSKYKFPTSVEFSKIRGDADWDDLQQMGNK